MAAEIKRACDSCNVRKVKCDGGNPCRRCVVADIACTCLRERKKSGPRGLRQSRDKILKRQRASLASVTPSEWLYDWQLPASPSIPFGLDQLDEGFSFAYQHPPEPAWRTRCLPIVVLKDTILLYNERLYGIWPLVRAHDLIDQLKASPQDASLYTLATALSAATLSYLDSSVTHELYVEPLTANDFVAESRRVRATFDYMEPVEINTILTSYFLHMHFGRQTLRPQMAIFYIREAITFAHMLGLHNEDSYALSLWSPQEQAVLRRLYFLLFMTERYLCIREGLPPILETITLPEAIEGGERYPDVVNVFLHLVSLFSTPDKSFFRMWATDSNSSISRDQLLLIQRAIQHPLSDLPRKAPLLSNGGDDSVKAPRPDNPVQCVDVIVSQHWFRSLAWKQSMLRGYLSPNVSATGVMSVGYPLQIARDTLHGIQDIPKAAFEAHGPGMEAKMCEIAMALTDSIVWSERNGDPGLVESKVILRGLADRILETQVMDARLRGLLTERLDASLKCTVIAPSLVLAEVEDDGGEFTWLLS